MPTHSGSIASSKRTYCTSVTRYDSTNENASDVDACADTTYDVSLYHDGSNATPTANDTVFTDKFGCNKFDGKDLWYSDSAGVQSYKINGSGLVTSLTKC